MSTLATKMVKLQRDHYLHTAQYLEALYLTLDGHGPESVEALSAANPTGSNALTANLTSSALNAISGVIFNNQEDAQKVAMELSLITTSELIMSGFDVNDSYTAANVMNDLFTCPSDLEQFIPEGMYYLEYVGVCFAAVAIFTRHLAEDDGGTLEDLLAAAIGHALEFHRKLGGTGDLQFVKVNRTA